MRVHVVGGGLAGLLAAAELRRRGHSVVVSEAGDRLGGVADTEVVDDEAGRWLLEPAVSSVLPHPLLQRLAAETGTELVPAFPSPRRYVVHQGRLVAIPGDPVGLLRWPVVGAAAKARALAEPLIRSRTRPDETLQGFLVRRFGKRAGGFAAHLAASGVFAGDPREVAAAALPQLVGMEKQFGSIIAGVRRRATARRRSGGPPPRPLAPRHGMAAWATDLGRYVGDVRLGASVQSVERHGDGWSVDGEPADGVILACPPDRAPSVEEGPREAPRPPAAAVVVCFLGGASESMSLPEGSGVLAGPDSPGMMLGALFERAPDRAPQGSELAKLLVGGARNPQVEEMSDEAVIAEATAELGDWLGAPVEPSFRHVVHARIPQYTPAYLAALRASPMPAGIVRLGWGADQVGLGTIAAAVDRLADTWE